VVSPEIEDFLTSLLLWDFSITVYPSDTQIQLKGSCDCCKLPMIFKKFFLFLRVMVLSCGNFKPQADNL